MSPIARADDSHDGRYTHPNEKAAVNLPTDYPRMLHGKATVKNGQTVSDTKTVRSKAEEDEAIASGSWKADPAEWHGPRTFTTASGAKSAVPPVIPAGGPLAGYAEAHAAEQDAKNQAAEPLPAWTQPLPLRNDGPTLEDYEKAGYNADTYPPNGFAEVHSPALKARRDATVEADKAKGVSRHDDVPRAVGAPVDPAYGGTPTRAQDEANGQRQAQDQREAQHQTSGPGSQSGQVGQPGGDQANPGPETAQRQPDRSVVSRGGPYTGPKGKTNQSGQSRLGVLMAIVLAFALAVIGAPVLFGQTAVNITTLAAALAAPTQGNQQTTVNLTSGSTVAIGQGIFVDSEYMTVIGSQPSSTALWTVKRGDQGTTAQAHISGAVAYTGIPANFSSTPDPSGACVSTAEVALPRINIRSGSVFGCAAVSTLAGSAPSTWDRWRAGGLQAGDPSRLTRWTYVTAGALRLQSGVSFIGSGGALSMTITSPTRAMDGIVMVIEASTAQAHVVTYTTVGFNGNTTNTDVATFGGAIGDNLVIFANQGVWWVISTRNVTIA